MAKTTLIKFFSIATLLLAVAVFSFMPAKSTYAQGGGVLQQSAATGTAFTYQGSLIKSGTGVSDTCNFNFTLYDALSGGSVVGSPVAKNSVSISNGIFTVDLDFGGTAFDGNARYLDIQVQCTGDASMQQLSPRTALNGTPYAITALGLQPGVNVSGSDTSGRIFGAQNTATTGTGVGLYGDTQSATGAGVSGINLSSSTGGYGVYGGSDHGIGVYGNSMGDSGTPYGVYGIASDTGSATSYGVYGKSNSSVGTGVGGIAPMNGVYGEASNATGTTWGVYGKSNSAGGYGVYSSGNAHVEGALTWKAMTSTVSIPGLAFQPFVITNTLTRDLSGGGVQPADSASSTFYAPIQLPHNATVTELTFYWADSSNQNGSASLYRTDMQGNESFMVSAFSSGGSSGGGGGMTVTGSSSSTLISVPIIDNTTYSYYLYLNLPTDSNGATIKAYGVTVEYTITQPY